MKVILITIIILLYNSIFILCSRTCPTVRIKNGSAKVRAKGRIIRFRCNRGYTLSGEPSAACINGEWDVDIPTCVFRSRCTPITQIHNGHVIANKQWTSLRFICNSGYHLIGKTQLQCKNSKWDGEPPQCQTSVQLSCDFEQKGICGWDNSTKSGFFWLKRQYATPSHYLNTGPGHDHTLSPKNNGHYLYIETSGLYGKDLKTTIARLYSPLFPPVESNDTCFTFWYHMYGTTIGELNVYIDGHKVFHKAGSQGNRWIKGMIKNLPTDTFFQISIEGVPGNGWTGDIAIDDLNVTTSEECSRPEIEDTTCDGRCYEDESQNSTLCGCNEKCISTSTCCTDFFDICNAETTTVGISSNAFTSEDESTTRQEHFQSSTMEAFQVTSQKNLTNNTTYKLDLTTKYSTVYTPPDAYETSTVVELTNFSDITSLINFELTTMDSNNYSQNQNEISTETSDEIISTTNSSINLTSLVFHTHLQNNENITAQTPVYLIPFLDDSFEQALTTTETSTILQDFEQIFASTETDLQTDTVDDSSFVNNFDQTTYNFDQTNAVQLQTTIAYNVTENFDETQTQTLAEIRTTISFNQPKNSTESFKDIQTTVETIITDNLKQLSTEYKTNQTIEELLTTLPTQQHFTQDNFTAFNKEVSSTIKTSSESVITKFTTINNSSRQATTLSTEINDDHMTTTVENTKKEFIQHVQTTSELPTTNKLKQINVTTENTETSSSKDLQITTISTKKLDPIINFPTTDNTLLTTKYQENTVIPVTVRLLESEAITGKTKWKSKYKPKGYFRYSAIKQEQKGNGVKNIAIIIGIAVIFTTVVSIGIYVYRRRSFLNTSNNVEEADVLFIPTDEILDFSLSRPHSVNNRKIDVNKV